MATWPKSENAEWRSRLQCVSRLASNCRYSLACSLFLCNLSDLRLCRVKRERQNAILYRAFAWSNFDSQHLMIDFLANQSHVIQYLYPIRNLKLLVRNCSIVMSFAAYWKLDLCISRSQVRSMLVRKITVLSIRPRSSQLVEFPEESTDS